MSKSNIFTLQKPDESFLPILVSSPHSGVGFPDEVRPQVKAKWLDRPDDTDWFVDELYSFVPRIGGTLISANHSRYVIDLNRSVIGEKLYSDGRRETQLVPEYTFSGERIYMQNVEQNEKKRRIEAYYKPYHKEVRSLLQKIKSEYGVALLFEAHSIRRYVESISDKSFPDLIVGDQDGETAPGLISQILMKSLSAKGFNVSYNKPFKGGYLTRSMANKKENVFTIQLEMSQDIYLTDDRTSIDKSKAAQVTDCLKEALVHIGSTIRERDFEV